MGHRLLGHEEGRKEGRPSDGPHVLSAPREEHRLRLGPDSVGETRHTTDACDLRGGARRHRRQEAVRGSEEIDPKIIARVNHHSPTETNTASVVMNSVTMT